MCPVLVWPLQHTVTITLLPLTTNSISCVVQSIGSGLFASFLLRLFAHEPFFRIYFCHSFTRLLLPSISPSLFHYFLTFLWMCKLCKSLSPLFFSVSLALCLFLFFPLSLSFLCKQAFQFVHLCTQSIIWTPSQIPRCPSGGQTQHQTESRLRVLLKTGKMKSENKSRSTFKGLLVLAPKERKGYPSNFRGLPFCLEKWTMPKKGKKNPPCGLGLLTRICAFLLQDYHCVAPLQCPVGGPP